jgi:uncharacterized protein
MIKKDNGSTMLDKKLLALLVCPLCKGPLEYKPEIPELHCLQDKLAYPIKDQIPIMLIHEARSLVNTQG